MRFEFGSPLHHQGFYPLHRLVTFGDVAAVRKMLEEESPDINQVDFAGVTPLLIAVAHGNQDMIKLLLEYKADYTIQTRDGIDPLSLAKAKGGPEIQLLRDAGATDNMELKQPLAPFNEESQKALEGASGLTPDEVAAIQAAWALLTSAHKPSDSAKTVSDTAVAYFQLLFKNHPGAIELFPFRPSANGGQIDKARFEKHAVDTFTAVSKTIELLDDFPTLAAIATALLKRHVKYGVVFPDHYDAVLGTLAEFLAAGLGALNLWDAQQISAWTKFAGLVRAVGESCYKDTQPAAAAEPAAATAAASEAPAVEAVTAAVDSLTVDTAAAAAAAAAEDAADAAEGEATLVMVAVMSLASEAAAADSKLAASSEESPAAAATPTPTG